VADGEDVDPLAQVEYNLLKKNSELLARWCKVGSISGVQRFRSQETAFSPQTAPGRFIRLGVAIAVPTAIAAGVAIAATGSAAASTSAAAGAAAGDCRRALADQDEGGRHEAGREAEGASST